MTTMRAMMYGSIAPLSRQLIATTTTAAVRRAVPVASFRRFATVGPVASSKKGAKAARTNQAQEQTPPPLSQQREEVKAEQEATTPSQSQERTPTPKGGSLFDIDSSAQLVEAPQDDAASSRGGKTGAKARRSPSSSERKRQSTARLLTSVLFLGLGLGAYRLGKPWEEFEQERFATQPNADVFWGRIKLRLTAVYEDFNKPVFDQLLPDPLPFPYSRPYTMVVDLDDLLVHSEWSREHGWRTAKRPGLDYFLGYLSQVYEIVIFTTQPFYTAGPIIEKLDPDRRFIAYSLFRESCRTVNGKPVKDLNYLNRDLSKVIVLDTEAESFSLHPENGILIPAWKGDKADRELVGLIPWFEAIGIYNIEDVRKTIKAYVGTHIPTEHARRIAPMRERELAETKARQARMGKFGKIFSGVGRGNQPNLPADKTMYDLERERFLKAYMEDTQYWKENGEALRQQAKEDQDRQIREMKLNTWSFFTGGMKPVDPEDPASKSQ